MRRWLPIGVALSCCLAAPAAAGADEGVAVNPQSPTAKQYQLPLEQVRNATAQTRGDAHIGGSQSSRRSQPFGEGISPRSSAEARVVGGGTTGSPAARRQAAPSGRVTAKRPPRRRLALAAAGADGGSTTLWAAAIPLVVLLVGGGLGLALRRAFRRPG